MKKTPTFMGLSPDALGNGIDKIIEPYLPEIGYACDVGANNGLFFSNTKLFEDKGWSVLCVEANPNLVEDGKANRKLWIHAAAGPTDGTMVEFTQCGDYPWPSASGLHVSVDVPTNVRFQVPMRRLDTMLKEAGFPRLDLLSIDVELGEMDVLRGIDLKEWKPIIIVVEALYPPQEKEMRLYLESSGYKFLTKVEVDLCFKIV